MFKIYDVIPQYVNNINIYGNTRTKEKVIRREISFAEGDPYNDEQLGMSKSNLQRLGFFKSIDITDEKNNDDQIDDRDHRPITNIRAVSVLPKNET